MPEYGFQIKLHIAKENSLLVVGEECTVIAGARQSGIRTGE